METKGKTLEEIDVLFDGEKHSDVPDVDTVLKSRQDFEILHGQVIADDDYAATTIEVGTKK